MIQSVVDEYLEGARMGGNNNITAKCPFHRKSDGSMEKTPSFSMSLTNGLWHCFSCKEGGNLRQFLQKIGLDYTFINTRYGKMLDDVRKVSDNEPRRQYHQTPKQEALDESLLGLFAKCPTSLIEDGFSEETLQHFEVGFDDRHMRITYPLRDVDGELIGVSGRTVNGGFPRYKVYDREYLQYGLSARDPPRKSLLIWNMERVYPESYLVTSHTDILVVEGFKACMWVWQSGIKNVVALLGSSMSEYQEWLLLRTGSTIHLMLDTDDAGVKGTQLIGERLSKKTEVKVIEYEELQPDKCNNIMDLKLNSKNYFQWIIGNKYGIR